MRYGDSTEDVEEMTDPRDELSEDQEDFNEQADNTDDELYKDMDGDE